MRVLILADEIFASRERGLLMRLEVGLADEGVRVIHAVPEGSAADAADGVFSRVLTYSAKTLALTRPLAVRKLARALAEMDEAQEKADIDVVHVFGGSVWSLGADLATEVGAGIALEVWRSGLVERSLQVTLENDDLPLLLAPDVAIERSLQQHMNEDTRHAAHPIHLAPWGVLTPSTPRAIFAEGRATSIMLVGSGREEAAFRAALEGIAPIARERPDMLLFCDALAARRCGLWSLARKLGILHAISLIEELEARRDLILHGDILMQPEAHGEQRSVILEAMAGGMLVIAARDPMVSTLQDGVTARLVQSATPQEWNRVLSSVIENPEEARRLARSAQDFVRTHRRASDHIRAVLTAYDWLVSDEPIPFTGLPKSDIAPASGT